MQWHPRRPGSGPAHVWILHHIFLQQCHAGCVRMSGSSALFTGKSADLTRQYSNTGPLFFVIRFQGVKQGVP